MKRRLCFVLIIIGTLAGCQKTFISPELSVWIDNNYLSKSHNVNSYKFLVIAKQGRGFTTRYYLNQRNLVKPIDDAIQQCKKDLYDVNINSVCKVLYLGNKQVFYANDMELKQHINDYESRMVYDTTSQKKHTLNNWSDQEVIQYACDNKTNNWSEQFKAAVSLAKERGLSCTF